MSRLAVEPFAAALPGLYWLAVAIGINAREAAIVATLLSRLPSLL
jgi:hypothetical protein